MEFIRYYPVTYYCTPVNRMWSFRASLDFWQTFTIFFHMIAFKQLITFRLPNYLSYRSLDSINSYFFTLFLFPHFLRILISCINVYCHKNTITGCNIYNDWLMLFFMWCISLNSKKSPYNASSRGGRAPSFSRSFHNVPCSELFRMMSGKSVEYIQPLLKRSFLCSNEAI